MVILLFNDNILTKIVVSIKADLTSSIQDSSVLEMKTEDQVETMSLVTKEIKRLLEDQNKPFSYMSISFMILILVLLIARVFYSLY